MDGVPVGWAGGRVLAVYREWNDRDSARVKLWGLAGKTVRTSSACIAGCGVDLIGDVDDYGGLVFSFSEPYRFALYEYAVF